MFFSASEVPEWDQDSGLTSTQIGLLQDGEHRKQNYPVLHVYNNPNDSYSFSFEVSLSQWTKFAPSQPGGIALLYLGGTGPWVEISSCWLNSTTDTLSRSMRVIAGFLRDVQRISALTTSGNGKLKPWRTGKCNRVLNYTFKMFGPYNNICLRFPFGACPCIVCVCVNPKVHDCISATDRQSKAVRVYDDVCERTKRWMRWFPEYSQGEGQNHHLAEGPSNTQLSRSSSAHCALPGW